MASPSPAPRTPRLQNAQTYNCPICLAPPTSPFAPPCRHVFCYECLSTHLQTRSNCPLCHIYVTLNVITPALPPTSTPALAVSTPPAASPRTPSLATPDITPGTSSRRAAPPPLPRRVQPAAVSPSTAAARRARAERRARAALEDVPVSMQPRRPWAETDDSSSSVPRPSAFGSAPNSVAAIMAGAVPVGPAAEPSPEALLAAGENLTAEQLAGVIARLNQKLQEKEGSERRVETDLLLDFLKHTKREKVRIIETLKSEVALLETDVSEAEREKAKLRPEMSSTTSSERVDEREGVMREGSEENEVPSQPEDAELSRKRRRMRTNYDVLQNHYFETVAKHSGDARKRALRTFSDDIFKLTQYSRFRDRATLTHVARVPDAPCSDVFKASNIVSSIEFDRDSEFLATAGVTKRIKIFEFSNITRNRADMHYPVREIPTNAKLSWVCWNPYIRHYLVSSDYEGFVTLWDVDRGVSIRDYEEHENRAWSVDYCPSQPTLFASGSDDGRVKLWLTSQPGSILTIDNKPANVCSVKFHPTQAEKIAFGSVDYNVHYFDLRNPREALKVFKSHTRAVSYVKFMSPTELVSASVDSTIKLWDLNTMSLARTFTGHMNDKNFVGLSVTSDYIACGSEENTVYCYYKAIPRPFTGYRFSTVDPLTGEETHDDDESQFVSSVCWCPKSPEMLVAANSLGSLKVLALEAGENEGRYASR